MTGRYTECVEVANFCDELNNDAMKAVFLAGVRKMINGRKPINNRITE